jgi:hypothetical protein
MFISHLFQGGMWDWKKSQKVTQVLAGKLFSVYTEAEFLEVIETKFLAIHSHILMDFTPLPLEQKWFEAGL